MSEKWELLDQVSGAGIAAIIKGMLEAQGISVILSQEGIGETIYPVSVGPLSEIQLLVPSEQLEDARRILQDYRTGKLENLEYNSGGEAPLEPHEED